MAKRNKRTARYFTRDDEAGVTPSRLRRMSATRQLEYLTHWFETYYEDPGYQTSYESAEGGYLWNHGGPFDASEELFHEFDGVVPEGVIQQAVEAVQDENGVYEWAATSAHPDMREAYDEAMSEAFGEDRPGPQRSISERLGEVQQLLDRGTRPTFGQAQERAQRQEILDRLDTLEAELAKLKPSPAHGGIGHNNPPSDPQEVTADQIKQALRAAAEIKSELAKPEPDAGVVVKSTSALNSFGGWIARKADNFVDGVVKGASETTGKILAPMLIAGAATGAAYVFGLIGMIVEGATRWLEIVTLPF